MLTRRHFLAFSAAALAGTAARPRWLAARPARGLQPPDVDLELITRLASPYCGEPNVAALCQTFITPVERFFILDHGAVPTLGADHELVIEGAVRNPLRVPAALLWERPRREVTATLMCAGNRRHEHHHRQPLATAPMWNAGAIGTARWSGVRLADLLQQAEPMAGARHVWLDGADRVERSADQITHYGTSLPLGRAMRRGRDAVLLASFMNGAPLTRHHGFPLRAIVPGEIGARSVKWLRRIYVSSRPSPNVHFQRDHRRGAESRAAPIVRYPINAAICAVATPNSGTVQVAGYALAPGIAGRAIARVEVSGDHGHTWQSAELSRHVQPLCWRLWRAQVPVSPGGQLVARAIDSTGMRQPETTPWNRGGYVFNGWPRVDVEIPATR